MDISFNFKSDKLKVLYLYNFQNYIEILLLLNIHIR